MDRSIEKALSARAVELGRAGEPGALPELLELLGKPSGQVRRLAVSAIGKLAGLVDGRDVVPALQARLLDAHPQVRQYAIKALSAYGKVELNKTIRAKDGTLVQSKGERRIAEWLAAKGIAYRYDERFRIIDGYAIRPDFYLPEYDVYIEYWGMDTADYKIGMLKKQKLYQSTGKKLVSIYFQEFAHIEDVLAKKLHVCGAGAGGGV